ncbi:MAG TPA: hypothetical protein PKD52_05160 [Clostridiales bacterium]|nr:hypothetical protein [Clostridiales bacterium]
MFKRGSKITMLMLVVVFCAFALVGCGDTDNNTNNDTNDEITDTTDNNTTKEDTSDTKGDGIKITVTSPTEGNTVEGGTIEVVGTVDADDLTGIDKVKLQVLSKDDNKVLGEDTSLIADLDHQYSADVSYDLPDDIKKNSDGTVDAQLRIYIEDTNGDLIKEEKINIKVK